MSDYLMFLIHPYYFSFLKQKINSVKTDYLLKM